MSPDEHSPCDPMLCPWCRETLESTGWELPDRMFSLPGLFRWRRCPRCSTLVLENPPADLGAHYPEQSYYSLQQHPPARDDPFAAVVKKAAQAPAATFSSWLKTRFEPGASVLDVGCGSGAVLDFYRAAGWQTWGIEPSIHGCEMARRRGHRVLGAPFPEALSDPESSRHRFDLIRLRHVLEHLPEPRTSLQAIRGALQPEGLCLIEVPNIDGWLARIFGPDYWQLDPPRHVVLLSRPALAGLLREEGLRIEAWTSVSRPQGFARSLTFAVRRFLGCELWRLGDSKTPAGFRLAARLGRAFSALTDRFDRGDNLQIVAGRDL